MTDDTYMATTMRIRTGSCHPRVHTIITPSKKGKGRRRTRTGRVDNDGIATISLQRMMTTRPFVCVLLMGLLRSWMVTTTTAMSPYDPFVSAMQLPMQLKVTTASEGSLRNFIVAPTLAANPGSSGGEPGFYNPKRRVGRDLVVLSVAYWLLSVQGSYSAARPPARLLDATCATGVQGLRVAVESPLLARAAAAAATIIATTATNGTAVVCQQPLPELQVVLNDNNKDASEVAATNSISLINTTSPDAAPTVTVSVQKRVAQALLHEESFEICVLDAFGSPVSFLDASFANAPDGSLLEVCATDVDALYGSRPAVAKRHYGTSSSSTSTSSTTGASGGPSQTIKQQRRPPCYRERGVRRLLAAVAQAAGRHDRGIVPVWGVSTQHYCSVSLRVVRGARGADATAKQVQHQVCICTMCGAAWNVGNVVADATEATSVDDATTQCTCTCDAHHTTDEGPLWVGQLYDAEAVNEMHRIASLDKAEEFISKETRSLLETIKDEASVKNGLFHRRPGYDATGRSPKLSNVIQELKRRSYSAARTHFDPKALRTDASPSEFDLAVKAVLAGQAQPKREETT